MTGRRIYLASSWRNALQPEMVGILRDAGHDVYDFRNPAPGDTGFHWSQVDQEWMDWTIESYREAVEKHPLAIGGCRKDLAGLDWCDTCVLLQPCGVSANLELGHALGRGKTGIVYLNQERFEPELMHLLAHHRVCNTDELLDVLARAA